MKLRLDASGVLRELRRRSKAAVQAGALALEMQIRREIQAGIRGDRSGPRRVATGRYLESWSPGSADSAVQLQVSGAVASVEVTNRLDYADKVEFGDVTMRPGLHVHTAVAAVEKDADAILSRAMLPALQK